MQGEARIYSLPRWRVTRWLADVGPDVPEDIRAALIGGLFGTLPVFAGGVINTVAVSAVIAARKPTMPFIAWLIFELVACVSRLVALIVARRAAARRLPTPTDMYLLLGIAWSASVGYGVFVSLLSGDWVIATLACLSAAAMVGGICFRNFGAPRFAGTMILMTFGPCLVGTALAGEPLLYVVFLQAPLYFFAMSAAAFRLNKILVATMRAERENDHRARHDTLTGLANRSGLADAVDERLARGSDSFALLFLDLDGFKTVNDTYGHAGGDRLLRVVADRLRSMLRTADVAARIGGDEFVVLAGAATEEDALELGRRLVAAVTASYDLGEGISVNIGVSAGIAMAPEHGSDLSDLLAVADAALYEAKTSGKSRCCMATPMTNLAVLRRLKGKGARVGAAA